MEKQRKEVN